MHSSVKNSPHEGWLAYAQVFVAAFSLTVASYFLERNYDNAHRNDLRLKTSAALAIQMETFHKRIWFEFASAKELQKRLSDNPNMGPDEFQTLARSLMEDNPDLLFLSATGQSSATLAYGRGGVLPEMLDSASGPRSRQDYLIAMPEGYERASFGAVVGMRSGALALKITVPVFTNRNGSVVHWGSVTSFIDAAKFFKKTGLTYDDGKYHLAIQLTGHADNFLEPFFTADQVRSVLGHYPVKMSLDVLSDRWFLAATPVNGWERSPEQIWTTRAIFLGIGIIVLLPFFRSLRLIRLNRDSQLALARRELLLQRLTKRLDLALGSYQCGVWEAGIGTDNAYWDERMQDLHGVTGRADWASWSNWLSLIHPDDKAAVIAALPDLSEKRGHLLLTVRIIRPDGAVRYIRYVSQVHEEPNEAPRLVGIAVDVTEDTRLAEAFSLAKQETERKNAELEAALDRLSGREAQLQEVTRRFQLATQAFGCGVWEADIESGIAVWDRRMHEYFDVPYTDGTVDDQSFLKSIYPEDLHLVQAAVADAIENGKHYSCNYRIMTGRGEIRHLQAMGQTHRTTGGKLKFIGIALDVSDQFRKKEALIAAKNDAEAKRAELEAMHAMLQHNATHDPLTGLHNRRALDAALERLAGEAQDPLKRVTLLHIDLDRFKQINDTLGHAAGDAMLVHAANVLRRNAPDGDLVARIGGDEFVVLLQNGLGNRDIAALATRIIDQMNVPLDYEGQECRFGVSIGIAREQTRRSSVKHLLVNADIALYRAKAHGRNRFEFFTSNLQAEIRRNKTLADQILRGLENREFVSWYQPQFCAKTHALTGVEALVRWNHPERGLLTPDHFLKNAEEINALAAIDAHVLEQALADRLSWMAQGLTVPKISVNVSARRLRDDQLLKSLKDLAIAPGQIAFELVESIYLDDDDDVVTRNIRRLKSLGIEIEIDDFGTGHTSIVSLLKLEPKRLKIDRQLVQPMLVSSREFSLVRSIIDIGTSLDIETVAEGVETMTHAMRLEELGCSTLQGYAFARPLQATDLVDFIASAPWKRFREPPFLATAI